MVLKQQQVFETVNHLPEDAAAKREAPVGGVKQGNVGVD